MKDFAGSSITYYGLAREKLISKYPRHISVLIILALIFATGLAIFLIYDLVSFASNPDYKGLESGVPSLVNDKETSGNIGPNSSLNTSRQIKEQSPVNLSKMNASLLSNQTAKGVFATGKSSSSSSLSSVDKKSGNSLVTGHHSSSSSSSSKSSSANSAKKSSAMNNLTNETATMPIPINETATAPMLTNQSMNNSQVQESPFSNASSIATTEVLASLPSAGVGSFPNLAEKTPAREPVSIIEFKTETKISPKSKQDINPDNGAGAVGTSASDNAKNAKSSKVATKNIKLKTTKTKTASSMKSKSTSSSQAEKVTEARDKMKANKDRIEQNMKKKAAQLRSKAA